MRRQKVSRRKKRRKRRRKRRREERKKQRRRKRKRRKRRRRRLRRLSSLLSLCSCPKSRRRADTGVASMLARLMEMPQDYVSQHARLITISATTRSASKESLQSTRKQRA